MWSFIRLVLGNMVTHQDRQLHGSLCLCGAVKNTSIDCLSSTHCCSGSRLVCSANQSTAGPGEVDQSAEAVPDHKLGFPSI